MKDTAFRPHLLERWKSALPQARVVPLPNAGHWPHEEEPDAVIKAVGHFLRADRP
jgi:pimeloyl-ACP methyl ester carboxylesterase